MKKINIKKWISILLSISMLSPFLLSCANEVQQAVESNKQNTIPSQSTQTNTQNDKETVMEYEKLMANLDTFPITFQYDGVRYNGFAGFTEKSRSEQELENGTKTTLILTHPRINASFELVTNVYPRENAYEYVVYIHNQSEENTKVFANLQFEIPFKGSNPMLKGIKGDANGQYYTPYAQDLTKNTSYTDTSTSGRPTHGTFPYYNLSYGEGGTFVAVGWSGRWKANFTYNKASNMTILKTGQYAISSYIAPGETMRTPLMGFVEYKGLSDNEQTNAWRHYYINDVMRKIDGELTPTYAGISYGAVGKTTSKTLLTLKSFFKNGIEPELLWIDAGWYTGANGEAVYWPATGTYNMDTNRYPDRMAEIGQFTAEHDMEFMLWFEPEIVRLDKNAFLKNQKQFKEEWLIELSGTSDLLVNLGNAQCRNWVLMKIFSIIDTAGLTAYRQDFNTDPASGWDNNDKKTPNRTGMTENLYVQGYLALWDAIIARYPGIYIDSCASGGGRNDLESMKRAVPLHYSDWFDDDSRRNDYETKSRMTQALYAWFPYFKNEIYAVENTYQTRMNLAPLSLLNVPNALDPNAPWELLRQAYSEHDLAKKYFYADYYQLTVWTKELDRWNGWEFFDPETNTGIAYMFRHETTTGNSTVVRLKGLDANMTYKIYDLDGLVTMTATGKSLMETGFTLTVPDTPYGAMIMIQPA